MRKVFKGKPCFCGAVPEVYEAWSTDISFDRGFFVMCPKCRTRTEFKGTKIAAVNKWNRRVVYIPSFKTRIMRKIKELKKTADLCEHYVLFVK